MSQYNRSTTPIFISVGLGLMLVANNGISESAMAGQIATGESFISLEFQPPGDIAPRDATGGATRGQVKFQPPGDVAPRNATAGATRGNVTFQPPTDVAPRNATAGATRGNVTFQPPTDAAPSNTTAGATRGNVTFQPPTDAAPSNTTAGATRGNVTFQPPTDAAPNNTTAGATRNNFTFQPPEDPAPNNTIGGSTRDELLSEVIPLIPGNNHGRTVSSHPTIYVYVPRTTTRKVFFSLQDEHRNEHYQTTLEISGNGGIVSVTLPEHLPELEIGKNYVWFFAPIKPGDILQPDNYGVTGWVKRVESLIPVRETLSPSSLERASLYAGQGIWYDTLNVLVSAKLSQPANATVVTEWQDLLENVGLEEIATQPISEQL